MLRLALLWLLLGLAAAPARANAELARADQAGAELAKARACLGCHHASDKRVGPPFNAVAARYAGVPGAEAHLANKIVNGGKGVWGVVVMPANPRITAAEAKQLAAWVLRQK